MGQGAPVWHPAAMVPSPLSLIPRPDQVVGAGINVVRSLFGGGLADLRPMPRTLIDDGTMREVYHYRPVAGVPSCGDPVLLVTPLAAPAICFDLRRGCSLVEHLVRDGRPTYLVEYGPVAFSDRGLGIEHWVTEVVPAAIREVSRHGGDRPVHVVGWSLGGIFAALTAADDSTLPIASVSALGAPVDTRQVPLVAPLRPLLDIADGALLGAVYRVLGTAPRQLVKRAFQLSTIDKLVTKPVAQLRHLDDADFLAQLEAVDRFTDHMSAYPGRSFGQLYHRFVRGNLLATGEFDLGDRTVSLARLKAPLLVVAGSDDVIAPVASVRPLVDLASGAASTRLEVAPGGHLGMLTGRSARRTTWRLLRQFMAAHDPPAQPLSTNDPVRPRTPVVPTLAGTSPQRRFSSGATRDALRGTSR